MIKRSKDWNDGLAEDMKDMTFAREFIIASIDEGLSLQEAIGKAVRAYGVKEFSDLSGIPDSNILRAIDPNHNPTQKTLTELLKLFGLRLSVVSDEAV